MFGHFLSVKIGGGLSAMALLCVSLFAQAQSVESVDSTRATQLADLAFAYGGAGLPGQALMLLEEAQTYSGGDCFESTIWLKIGVAYQVAGKPGKGKSFLEKAAKLAVERTEGDCYGSSTSPTESFLNRAAEYSELGYLDIGLQVANQLDSVFGAWTLAEIAGDYAALGQEQDAKKIITEAIEEHRTLIAEESEMYMDDEANWSPNRLLVAMAFELIESEQFEMAAFVLEQSNLVAEAYQSLTDPNFDVQYTINVANLLIELEQTQQARELLEAIAIEVEPLEPFPTDAVSQLSRVAQLLNQVGSSRASEVMAQAEDLAKTLSTDEELGFLYGFIVRGYAELGDFERAKAIAADINNVSERSDAYEDIANVYAKQGDSNAANSLVKSIGNSQFARQRLFSTYLWTEQYFEAEQIARQPDILEQQQLAFTYCNEGLLDEAIELMKSFPADDYLRMCVVTELASQGEFERALALAEEVEDDSIKADALINIANYYTNPTSSVSSSLWNQMLVFLQRLFGRTDVQTPVEILDRALEIVQS